MEKAVAEDPTIFEYDSIHEKLENQRHKATVEQKEADKEKKVGQTTPTSLAFMNRHYRV